MAATASFWWGGESHRLLIRCQGDCAGILAAARVATERDWLGWWTGSWIYPGTAYYRPLTSMLMAAEWRVFGEYLPGFCAVGWVLHGVNAAILFLLCRRLFGGGPWGRTVMPGAAVALFTLPTRWNLGVAAADVRWWPAQGDILSLTFSLGSLLLLDRALEIPGRARLGPALLLFAMALLTKEMAIALPLPAALLAAARRRDWRPVLLAYLSVAALFLWIRVLAVPQAQGPEWNPRHLFRKLLFYVGHDVGVLLASGVFWVPAASLAIPVAVMALRRRGVEWPWIVPVPPLVIALTAQAFGAGWACVFLSECLRAIAWCTFYIGAAYLLWRVRHAQPVTFVVGAVLAANVPILHVGGTHYHYWPAAVWGIAFAMAAGEGARLAWDAIRGAFPEWHPSTAAGRWLRGRIAGLADGTLTHWTEETPVADVRV